MCSSGVVAGVSWGYCGEDDAAEVAADGGLDSGAEEFSDEDSGCSTVSGTVLGERYECTG